MTRGKDTAMNEHITRLSDCAGTAFATTPAAYRQFVRSARLRPVIATEIRSYRQGRDLLAVGAAIRTAFAYAEFPAQLTKEVLSAYAELGGDGTLVAVRSENTTGLPRTAWRSESFLNVGNSRDVLAAVRRCYAAAFSDRSIAYREEQGLDQLLAAPTVGIRPMEVLVTAPGPALVQAVRRPDRSRRPVLAGARFPVAAVPEPVG
jgi:phosphoenolpyruvate synthase/pyruvate phosphate dikinase